MRANKLKIEARGQEKTIDELPVKPFIRTEEDPSKTLPLVYPSGSNTEGTFLWNQQSSLETQQSSLELSQSSLRTGQTFIGREQQTSSETQQTSLRTEQTSSGSAPQSELEHPSDRKEMVKKRYLSKEDSETILTLVKFYTQAFTKGQETEVRPGANLEDLLNTTKQTVQKFIAYLKHVEDFTSLDQKTQILLLKSRMMNSLVLRASYDYHKDNHSYNLVHTDKPVECDNLKEAFGAENTEYVEKLFQLNKSLQDKYGKDSKMYTILHLIVLFNPCVPDLKNCQFVSDLQIKYITLLKHYLESRFSYSESKTHFAFLLQKLNEVDSTAEGVMKVICGTLLTDVDPLMIEVLNL